MPALVLEYNIGQMLDDLKMIHQRDKSDALGVASKQSQQYAHNFGFRWKPPKEIRNVVVAGMGGSGLAARAGKSLLRLDVPFEVVNDYRLPEFVDRHTLLICSSYSGNTEETLACLNNALSEDREDELKPMVVAVTSGGELLRVVKDKDLPHTILPGGFQPRMTFGYQLRALCEIFQQAGLCHEVVEILNETSTWLAKKAKNLLPDVPTKDNPAKQLALELVGNSIVVYSGPLFAPAAYKWKISFNENAKNIAWQGVYPEFNHNEFLGWTSHPIDKPYKIVELRSNLEYGRTQKRFSVSEKLLSGLRPVPEVVEAAGSNLPQQMLWAIMLGDLVSIYTALLNGLDPTPVDLIAKLKRELAS